MGITERGASTVDQILRLAEVRLEAAGCDTPKGDAQWIIAQALGVNRTSLLAHATDEIHEEKTELINELIGRRAEREPLAYVLGTANFRGLVIEVGPGVFVPRPETEVTAERAILRARERGMRPTVVDVCTGAGAIALSVAAEVPNARVFATEASGAARGWTLRNLARTGLRVTLLPGDLLEPLHPALGGAVDVVVCNPPYVPARDWELLPDEIRRYEPRDAVTGGHDGLDVVMRLLGEASRWISPGGWIVIELGEDQPSKIAKLLGTVGYDQVLITGDLAGRERVVEGRWTGML